MRLLALIHAMVIEEQVDLRAVLLEDFAGLVRPKDLATFYEQYNMEGANQASEILQEVGSTCALLAGEMSIDLEGKTQNLQICTHINPPMSATAELASKLARRREWPQ
jgi:hypothetical protein